MGLLDEFFLFARSITEKEIKEIMEGDFLAVAKAIDKLSVTWGEIKAGR